MASESNSKRRAISTSAGPEPAGKYSQAIVAGGWVFVAGQGPFDPVTGDILGTTVSEQTEQTMRNIETILKAAGAELKDVVRVNAHITDFDHFDEYNAAYAEFFGDDPPTRITVASDLGGILVEIEVQALLPEAG